MSEAPSTPDTAQTVTQQQIQPATEQSSPTPTPNETNKSVATQGNQAHGTGPGQQIMEMLQGLPEAVARAVREATPTPAPAKTDTTKTSTDKPTGEDKTTSAPKEPGNSAGLTRQQRFVKWWGGS